MISAPTADDWAWIETVEQAVRDIVARIEKVVDRNQAKVLSAFQQAQVSESHLWGSTGYGYGDRARDQLDAVFASAFGAEAALVRPHFVSGTHALAVAFFGLLRPGDQLLYGTGSPYDTLHPVIGLSGTGMGSLRDFGVRYDFVPLCEDGSIDLPALTARMDDSTKVVALQRSAGYAWRRSLTVRDIGEAVAAVKSVKSDVFVVVDNCYGEFTEELEPSQVDADLTVGSLIKNPGGGIAPTGGYLVGTERAVQLASFRLTAPGLGGEAGSHESYRLYFQGLFLAPHIVGEALKGLAFASEAFTRAGFECAPRPSDPRGDLVLRVKTGSAARLLALCRAVQQAAPVDAHVTPEPWAMPGYNDPVVMASGAFIQGSSMELSADGPLREPYTAYLQGGLTYSHVKLAVLTALRAMASAQ